MRRRVALPAFVLAFLLLPPLVAQSDAPPTPFSAEELENLLAPIALYPDPLLAQLLPAATFPDQITEAAAFLRANPDDHLVGSQGWDVSVKAVAHCRSILLRMANRIDWTTALGDAWATQPDDVMDAIQRLRQQARDVGNLVSNEQEEVVDDGGYIEIWPAGAEYLDVPVYDSSIVYFGRGPVPAISAHRRYRMGSWFNRDCDWHGRRIFYHGWQQGRPWVDRSRPHIHNSHVYINDANRTIQINRAVIQHKINRNNLLPYHSLHQEVYYGVPQPTPPAAPHAARKYKRDHKDSGFAAPAPGDNYQPAPALEASSAPHVYPNPGPPDVPSEHPESQHVSHPSPPSFNPGAQHNTEPHFHAPEVHSQPAPTQRQEAPHHTEAGHGQAPASHSHESSLPRH